MGPFYRVLFIVACRHIAITQIELVTDSRPSSKSFTSRPNGAKKISYAQSEIQP